MRHKHCLTWNMARNTEKGEKCEVFIVGPGIWRKNWKMKYNEKLAQQDLKYGQKHWKRQKMRQKNSLNQNMAKKLKNVENEKHTLQDLEYSEKE